MNYSCNAQKDGFSGGSLENKPPKEGRSNNKPKQDSDYNKTQNSEASTQASRGTHQDDNIDNMHREGTQAEKLPTQGTQRHGANDFVEVPILLEDSNSSNRGSDTRKRRYSRNKNSGATGRARQIHSEPAWDDYKHDFVPPPGFSMPSARPPSSRKRKTNQTQPENNTTSSDSVSESYQGSGNMPFDTFGTRSERSTSAGPQQKSTTFDKPVLNTSDAYPHRSIQEKSSAAGSSTSQRSSHRRKQSTPRKCVGGQENNGEDSQAE